MTVPEPQKLCNLEFAKWLFNYYSQQYSCCVSCEDNPGIEVELALCPIQCPPDPDDEGTPCESGVYYQPLLVLANHLARDRVTEKTLINERVKLESPTRLIQHLRDQQVHMNKCLIPCWKEHVHSCPPPMCISEIKIEDDPCCDDTCCDQNRIEACVEW